MKFIQTSLKFFVLSVFVISFTYPAVLVEAATPKHPVTKISATSTVATVTPKKVKAQILIPVEPAVAGPLHPVRIIIPDVGINSPIQSVGLTSNGEMAVPDGKSNNVGWWKDGTEPGDVGSAVLDAHVFAAFKPLSNVAPGDDIYVDMSDGTQKHFIVSLAKSYALNSLSSSQLFRQTDSPDLNLITCSGKLTADHSTYDHRFIVYSTLVKE